MTWAEVAARLAGARTYWLGTVTPSGAPHAAPVWGAVHDGTLYLYSERRTAKARNLAANPRVVVHLGSGEDVLIVSGLGPVGLLTTLFGSRMGAEVVGIDPSPERRGLAESLGARKTFDPTTAPIVEQVRAAYPDGADKLVEASGAGAAHEVIGSLLRPLGMAALVGLGSTDFKMPLGQIVHREIIVFGTSIFPTSQYDEIWRFCRRHAIAPSQVVTQRFGVEQGAEAFRLADRASTGKVCLTFDSGC